MIVGARWHVIGHVRSVKICMFKIRIIMNFVLFSCYNVRLTKKSINRKWFV